MADLAVLLVISCNEPVETGHAGRPLPPIFGHSWKLRMSHSLPSHYCFDRAQENNTMKAYQRIDGLNINFKHNSTNFQSAAAIVNTIAGVALSPIYINPPTKVFFHSSSGKTQPWKHGILSSSSLHGSHGTQTGNGRAEDGRPGICGWSHGFTACCEMLGCLQRLATRWQPKLPFKVVHFRRTLIDFWIFAPNFKSHHFCGSVWGCSKPLQLKECSCILSWRAALSTIEQKRTGTEWIDILWYTI